MVGEAVRPEWLQTDWLLGQFGSDRLAAIRGFIDFVRAGVGMPSLWQELRSQIYLGSEHYVAQMKSKLESPALLTEVPRAQRRPIATGMRH
jgi:hypothetical protein